MKLKLNKPIVLVGMMGSGKSTVGRRLAKRLGLHFYDSDRIIEDREGLSIVDIHDFRGEEYFYNKEKQVIEEILSYGPIILSTGGNSFVHQEIRDIIANKGAISIWLDADLETLYQRVVRRNTRPELNVDDKMGRLEELADQRRDIYSQADIKVETNNDDVYFLVDTVMKRLSDFLAKSEF